MFRENEQHLRDLGAQDVMWVACDVSKMEEVQALHDAVYAKWNDCGYLHNNAGIMAGAPGFDSSFTQELRHWHMTIDVDLFGVIHGLKAFVPTMLEQKKEAVVVSTSSICGLMNSANSKNGMTPINYSVAKHGVTLIMESLDAAMRSRSAPISVHALCPNGVASEGNLSNMVKKMPKEQAEKVIAAQKKVMLSPSAAAEVLRDCIEKGRFYCVTPDASGDINVSRSWMLQRAEDFILDRP